MHFHRFLSSIVASGILIGQPTAPPKFDIADVHRSASAANPYTWVSGGMLRGGRYDLRKATMLDLIRIAYDVAPGKVLGGPAWLEFDRFDIAAKTNAGTSPETVRVMLQALLSERFKLALHKDTKPLPSYVLTIASGKSKLKETEGNGVPGCHYKQQPPNSADTVYECRNITMNEFVEQLGGMANDYLTNPLSNETGLEGEWDFDLRWNARARVPVAGAERITIFDALERQLGLSLLLKKSPQPVIAIDHVNETPTDNPPGVTRTLPPRELEFEVADVKLSRPDEKGYLNTTPAGGLEARGIEMKILLATAWDVDWDHADEMISGMPKFVESMRVDINAKAPAVANGPPSRGTGFMDDDLRLMLRALLTERFQMKTHVEDKLINSYTLVAARPKMTRADPANRANCRNAPTMARDPRDLYPQLSRLIACENVTMAQFASRLHAFASDEFAWDVADATGIEGAWDFTLSYTPAGQLRAANTQQAGEGTADPDGGISLADAINRQLGLRLEKRKRMQPVIVIDHMDEKPTDN